MPLTLPGGREVPDSERTRCEVWSRVMGYWRPVAEWNIGKQAEHRDRQPFREPAAHELQRRLFE